jgi:hypothetical protein
MFLMLHLRSGSLLLALVAACVVLASPAVADPIEQPCTSNISLSNTFTTGGYIRNGVAYYTKSFTIATTVTSSCAVHSVEATAFGQSTPLIYGFGQSTDWRNNISLVGRPQGYFHIFVTATDVNGATAQRVLQIPKDDPPTLSITAPIPAKVARPSLRVTAACLDDATAGCASLVVFFNGIALLSGAQSYDTDVFLGTAQFSGLEVIIEFRGTDSIGNVVTARQLSYVELSTDLVEVASSPIGQVLDDGPRYQVTIAASAGQSAIPMLRDKSQGTTTALFDAGVDLGNAFVTDSGAIVTASTAVRESRDGQITELGSTTNRFSLRVAGNYAIWATSADGIVRRDLAAGTNAIVGPVVSTSVISDVAATGEVARVSSDGIQMYRNGSNTTLFDGESYEQQVVTDGTNVAYAWGNTVVPTRIRLFAGTDMLLSDFGNSHQPVARRDYAINSGWVAFLRPQGSARPLWIRSPQGEETQVTFTNDTSAAIEALNRDGRLVFRRASRTYLWHPGQPVRDIAISAWSGNEVVGDGPRTRAFFRDDVLYIIIGASVFRYGQGAFTDPTITAGVSPIRATHLTELRSRIAAARTQRGLAAFTYTDPDLTAGMAIRSAHITELRTSLLQVYDAAGVSPPSFTDPDLGPGSSINVAHVTELRASIIAIE